MLGNLPPQHRSRQNNIHLAIMCSSHLLSKYGYQEILRPLLDDLRKLETEGINIKFDNCIHQSYGTLTTVVADYLAAHALGGFFCSFSTVQRFCRFCNCSQEYLKANLPSWYDNNVLNVNADKTLPSVYGIKENLSLNCLQHYHRINGRPSDIAHNIFKGFVTDFLQKFQKFFHTSESLDIRNSECSNKLFQLFSYWPA